MKKLTFILIALFTFSMSYGQIRVITNGDVGIGTTTPTEQLEVDGISKTKGNTVEETAASASTLYNRTDRSAFLIGAGAQAGLSWDQDYNFSMFRKTRADILNRTLSGGTVAMSLRGSDGWVSLGVFGPTERLHVAGNIFATGTITPSDMRLKGESTRVSYGLNEILELEPVNYRYNGKANLDTESLHYGLIAQDLQKVMPNLVSEFVHEVRSEDNSEVIDEETYLKINSGALTYILINAVKEQQELINELNDKVNSLSSVNVNNEDIAIVIASINGTDKASALGQNEPNPHSGFTRIPYTIEEGKTGVVNVYDASGALIKTIQLDGSKGVVDLSMNNMSSGTFTYNLVVDGLVIEAKKMVLVK